MTEATLHDAVADEPPVLFCLPHAGASAATTYRSWDAELSDLVRVIPLELAGRGRRAGEPAYPSMRAAAWDCAHEVIAAARSAPFALLGHSIGGLLAYEVDAALLELGARRPAAVAVSGTAAPTRTARPAPIHALPDDGFLAAVEQFGGVPQIVLEHPAAREYHLSILRSDFRIFERYEPARPPHRLAGALLVMHAAHDPVTAPQDPALWEQLTADDVTTWTVPTHDHFFLETHRRQALATLRAFLTRVLR